MYGLHVAEWGRVEGGYRNASYSLKTTGEKRLNFILYKREPESVALIYRTNKLGSHLLSKGLPVRAPVDERILKVGDRYGSLYAYLDGTTIPWEAYTMKHIKLLGFTLGRFHELAGDFAGELPDVEDVYLAIYERMQTYFSDKNIQNAMGKKLHLNISLPDFSKVLEKAKKLSGRTNLHMDMVRGNVLFRPALPDDTLAVGSVAVSGIIDLEKAAFGHPLFDIARTLAFLLVDCPKLPEKIYKYFLHSGYEKRGGRNISSDNNAILEALITMFLTYDFYKFLRQNPYESLHENHHFTHTAAMLKVRKVLQ